MWYSPVMAKTRRRLYTTRKRLVSEHFKRDGRPKRGFKSRGEAHAWLVESGNAIQQHAYHCSFCNSWHVAKS